ncbi:hypothetical protein GQX74_013661 [Glossina fuscipes]|nr:hypothetical protein GQX74_013661 [Glossina fuscipes]
MKRNITNSNTQLQQQSALLNPPSLQANVIRHALPVPPPSLAYEIIGSIKKATNRISERQQQQTALQGKGLSLWNEHIHKFVKYRALKEIYRGEKTCAEIPRLQSYFDI